MVPDERMGSTFPLAAPLPLSLPARFLLPTISCIGTFSWTALQFVWLLSQVIQNSIGTEAMQAWFRKLPLRVQESSFFRRPFSSEAQTLDSVLELDQELDSDLPIWLAAQKAVSRYEGFLSPIGPRSRLLRRFLTVLGLIPSTPEVPFQFDFDDNVASDPHLRFVQFEVSLLFCLYMMGMSDIRVTR